METQEANSHVTRYLVKTVKGEKDAQALLERMHQQGYKPILMSVVGNAGFGPADTWFSYTFEVR